MMKRFFAALTFALIALTASTSHAFSGGRGGGWHGGGWHGGGPFVRSRVIVGIDPPRRRVPPPAGAPPPSPPDGDDRPYGAS